MRPPLSPRSLLPPRSRRREVVFGLATMAITTATALAALEIWRADLHVPFAYRDDANLNLMVVKSIIDNGWYLENPKLGAPRGQELYDYPVVSGDHLNIILFKALGLLSGEPAVVLNIFFLLTFALVAVTAFAVMRRLGISDAAALVCASLYALLPYHFMRGETHLFLSAYYAVPLAAYLILAVLSGVPLFARRNRTGRGWFALASPTTLATVGICLVLTSASGSFYYAGFTVLLLAVAVVLRFAVTRTVGVLVVGGTLIVMILALSAIHSAPTLVYQHTHGDNEVAVVRQPFESEYYSLRLTQLILPLGTHRFDLFARTRETYDAWSVSTGIPVTEAALSALGTMGTLGFLGLLGVTLASAVGGTRRGRSLLLRAAGIATVVALLVATMGGFSSLIGLLYPQLRSWNRLSVFIAFFAFLAVAWTLDQAGRRLSSSLRHGRLLFACLLAVVFVLGALDQTSKSYVPAYEETAASYRSDRHFVRSIERRMPEDAAVFQLPYASFPESVPPPPGRTVVYDPLRPYFHSQDLRWSFGAMRGRPADWAARLVDEPLRRVVRFVSAVGFDGIYVDRLGYRDDDAADGAARELVRIVGQQPLSNDDGRLLFFDLRAYNERLRDQLSAEELASLRVRVLLGE